jgi:hypothetical protein
MGKGREAWGKGPSGEASGERAEGRERRGLLEQ